MVVTFERWDIGMKGEPVGAELGRAFQAGGTARAEVGRWNL